ncbi:hypothetical protein DFH06DRAFT_1184497 [Mycena polygramma]|nr:hypothetical protein DFH06DRAFT_1184497 [Mycena polygramma]
MEFIPPPPPTIIDVPDDSDDELGGVHVTKTALPVASNPASAFTDFDLEDEEDDEKEVEHKPLIAPSTDIKGDFVDALQDGFEFDGVFAWSQRYAIGDAPNPCLNVDGLGTVGIPLSERDARAIISASDPVYGTKGDASGIWTMPSEKIHFENPAWDAWVQKATGVAASTALTAYTTVKPSFALKKLMLHETSSDTTRYKEPINDDESNPKIGDFIVVLPGHFQGAQLQLRHAGQAKSLNFAHQSGLSTSVVAAYSGVEHTLAGVSSGYRLSLIYDIVQPITQVGYRPTLPEMQGATQKLHNIMLSWKQNTTGEAPQLLACLLQHKYSKTPNFSAKSLTGADALLISHLHPLARELKFRIHLAHVTLTVSTPCEADDPGEYGGYGGYGRRGYGGGWGRGRYYDDYDDDEDEDIDEEEFVDREEDREEHMSVQIVDLRGLPVDARFALNAGDLLNGSITDDDPDTEDFERDDRTSATRIQIYNRTVLLIWPRDSAIDSSVSVGDVYDYACNALRSSLTVAPTGREKKLIDQLLQRCQTHRQEAKLQQVVQVLRESADRWNDVQILLRTLKACGVDKNSNLMGPEGFVSAYQAFGFDALKNFYEETMKNDISNTRRHTLLARLTQMGVEEEDAEVSSWCKNQAEVVLRSLSNIDAAQIPWLADLGLSRGGEFLRDVIFPQLHAQKLDKTFWIPFLRQIQLSMKNIPTTSPEVVKELIVQCVAETVRNLPAFPTKAAPYYYGGQQQEKDSGAILEVIKLCVDTKNEALCADIFKKMHDAARLGAYPQAFPPWIYHVELFTPLIQCMQSAPAHVVLDSTFRPFFLNLIDAMVSGARTTPDGKTITPCPLADGHKDTIMSAARKAGGITVLKERLTAMTLKGHDSGTVQTLARRIMKEFPRTQMHDNMAKQAYNDLIITLVRIAIDTFNVSPTATAGYPYYYSNAPSDRMIDMVKFCFEVGTQNQCQRILLRLVPPPSGTTVAQHISKTLAPFLPVLGKYLVSRQLDFQTDPFKMFAAAVVKSFADNVMSQKPSEVVPVAQLQRIGCQACAECLALKAFFLSDKPSIAFARVQTIRTHLERQLASTRGLGVTWQTIKGRSPHTLSVTKPASMTALGLWAGNSQAGKTLLQALGDVATQSRILGAAYPAVHARIHGVPTPAVPMPLANANQLLNAQKRTADAHSAATAAKKPRMS